MSVTEIAETRLVSREWHDTRKMKSILYLPCIILLVVTAKIRSRMLRQWSFVTERAVSGLKRGIVKRGRRGAGGNSAQGKGRWMEGQRLRI